ncbi:hypothetical protein [Methylobacterium sp. WL8]|uniref:hypothetical protein n=1 Tax=Methylobacterium sp. WL8 TaxID=2603899 RepID=UPI001AEF1F65|nr:hypothetical protein [Methylobacterium sp. WL8]
MRSGTLSRTRIFRADPDLDAAVAARAARQGVPVSAFLRDTLRGAVLAPPIVSRPYGIHAHVPAASIPDVWPEVVGMLAAACARPGCDETTDTLRTACEREQAGEERPGAVRPPLAEPSAHHPPERAEAEHD